MTEAASKPLNLLFLCTGNSARSILAEAIANRLGGGRLVAYSAGSFPRGQVHPQVLAALVRRGYATEALRSKAWDEFAAPGAPDLHIVITVCDNAAGELCPIWPGAPVSAHWGLPDPAEVKGSQTQIADAFAATYRALEARIKAMVALPFRDLDPDDLKQRLDALAMLESA